jgi:betaine-aldehyde dehydrogenase
VIQDSLSAGVRTWPLFVGGEHRLASDGRTFDSVDPATGRLLAKVSVAGREDVDAAVGAATGAAPAWRKTSIGDRATCLNRLARALERREDEFLAIEVADNGTPASQLRADIRLAAEMLRFFAGLAPQLRGQTLPTDWNRMNLTMRRPFGVVARILPFNHPLLYAAGRLAAPVLAGNCVILKPSEHTSLSALAFSDDLAAIFPPGVVSVLTGFGSDTGDLLVTHPGIPRIAFTGGEAVGRLIQQRAAERSVKTVTLELGGKNPIVVFPDADMDLAIEGVVNGMNFSWQGQSCGSTSRLLVHRSCHDDFVGRLVERVEGLKVGLPTEPSTDVGAMVSQAQLAKVLDHVALAEEAGAALLCGGRRPDDGALAGGYFVTPAVIDDVEPSSALAQEEIFGPVLAVTTFSDYDDALRLANGVRYGLTASVFTNDLRTALSFTRDVEAGYVWVNDSSRHVPGAPFGGMKDSGTGREEDLSELESFTQMQNVHIRFDSEDVS